MKISQILNWPKPAPPEAKHGLGDATFERGGSFAPEMHANAMDSLRLSVQGGALQQRDSLNVRLLVQLRWLAILGQTGIVLLVAYAFRFHIRLELSLAVISASLWLNLILMRNRSRIPDWQSGLQLGFDTLQLAVLLGVNGGIDNPFCLMLIAPATVAAANLPSRHAFGVILIALLSTIALYNFALPLPWYSSEAFVLPPLYRLGLLTAVIIGIGFTSGYAWQAALFSKRMEQALGATRAVLEKEHRLSALGGLAAAAAHELGTPLGTLQVVAREMLNSLKPDDPLYEDAGLLVSQTQRCRDILKSLSQRPERSDGIFDHQDLADFLEDIVAPLRVTGKTHSIEVLVNQGGALIEAGHRITIKRRPEWVHALSAFVENATDFARAEVFIRVHVHATYVVLLIEDDGPGFAPEILTRLGEPYISSRQFEAAPEGTGHSHSGMGLGFFIAKTLCEHTGAVVSFGNRPQGGAYVKAMWRRDQIEILWSRDDE